MHIAKPRTYTKEFGEAIHRFYQTPCLGFHQCLGVCHGCITTPVAMPGQTSIDEEVNIRLLFSGPIDDAWEDASASHEVCM
jgi:hypothetical protein